jgi:hypothetical protein
MKSKGNPNLDVATKDVDNSVHDDSDINNDHDFLDVMILRKGRKIKHWKKQQKNASPKNRYTPNKNWVSDLSDLPPDPF